MVLTKINIDFFSKFIEHNEEEAHQDFVLVRVLRAVRFAVNPNNPIWPGKEEISLRKEDVLTLPLKYARILAKRGVIEEVVTNEYGLRKMEVKTHDMGKSGAENLANVEG